MNANDLGKEAIMAYLVSRGFVPEDIEGFIKYKNKELGKTIFIKVKSSIYPELPTLLKKEEQELKEKSKEHNAQPLFAKVLLDESGKIKPNPEFLDI